MNLRRYSQEEILDLRLQSGLKNCLTHKSPPFNVRAQILNAAARENLFKSRPTRSRSFNIGREYNILSFERFAKAKAYSLQIGVLIV